MAKITWTEEKIKNGFEKFFEKYGRYPNVLEIDNFLELPSSKQLQRRFGGVRQLREKLGLSDIDFTTGEHRSRIAKFIGGRGLDKEREIQKILVERFGEMFVHEQKPFNNYVGRLDFVIYTKPTRPLAIKNFKFAIDVFYPSDLYSLAGCINTKQRLYKNLDFGLILLQMNKEISQKQIDDFIAKKKNVLNNNIKVFNYPKFLEFISNLEAIEIFKD